MSRVLFVLTALGALSGLLLALAAQKQERHDRLPDSLGYADVISEGTR
jgi:hypothetical protein